MDTGVGGGPNTAEEEDQETAFSPTNSSKEHLNAGRGHQAPRKADHCLQKQLGKNIKDGKKRQKR